MLFWTFTKEIGDNAKAEESFEKLCKDIDKNLRKFVMRLMNNDIHSAEEVIQDTYETALKKRDKVLASPNPSGWMINTANNLCRKHWEKEKIKNSKNVSITDDIIISAKENINSCLIKQIASKLSEKEKVVYWGYYVNDKSLKQIAEDIGDDYANLKVFNSRLKVKLAKIVVEIQQK